MLLDDLLPRYHFRNTHERKIEAPVERVWTSVLTTEFSRLKMIRFLFRLRGYDQKLPVTNNLMNSLRPYGFLELAARQYQELVIGGIGKPWHKDGGFIHDLDTERFLDFSDPGFVKMAANILLAPIGRHSTTLVTETRVEALDDHAEAKFAQYWALIKRPSGWIRRSVLKDIAARSM
jgi:hypothetical protein